MIDFDIPKQKSSIIKVIGVGGGGGNAVNHMYSQKIENVDFIICNTDAQALENSAIPNKIQLGPHLTQGLGAGANPNIGKQATEESLEEIKRILEVNTKMAFVCAGMGGGTGTGGAPIIAKICQELDILTVGIVTTPFSFEGPKRRQQAENGIKELEPHVDTLLVISNDKLRMQHKNLKMREAFGKADDVLSTAAKCITDIINSNGQINVDFADVCTVMRKGGVAILGSAICEGEDRAQNAIEDAINSPLLNDNNINGAKWILLNINTSEGDHECGTDEFELINDFVRQRAGEHSDVIVGMGVDNTLGNGLSVTLIATGFEHKDPFDKEESSITIEQKDKVLLTLDLHDNHNPNLAIKEPVIAQEVKPNETELLTPTLTELEEKTKTTVPSEIIIENNERSTQNLNLEIGVENILENVQENELIIEQKNVNEDEDINEAVNFQYSEKEEPNQSPSLKAQGFLHKPSNIYASNPSVSPKQFEPVAAIQKDSQKPIGSQINGIPALHEEEDMQIVYKEQKLSATQPIGDFENHFENDLSDEEIKRRKAADRLQKLRNLSYNIQSNDPNSEFDAVPAYVRKNLEALGGTESSAAESYYSKYTVNKEDNDRTNISSLNAFLEGKKPD